MGKKRIITKSGGGGKRVQAKTSKKRVAEGRLYIHSTYNNTKLLLTDKDGGALIWSTAGALGFSGARKATPYAAAKVGELLADSAENMGMKEVEVIVKGVGAGRESSIRSFAARGVKVTSIKDKTPIPHGGVKAPKPRRI
jgi:small subunit ribosomal protein S11